MTAAETLRKAAKEARAFATDMESDHPNEARFDRALADWFDDPGCGCYPTDCDCCGGYVTCDDDCRPKLAALAVAHAYLGTDTP